RAWLRPPTVHAGLADPATSERPPDGRRAVRALRKRARRTGVDHPRPGVRGAGSLHRRALPRVRAPLSAAARPRRAPGGLLPRPLSAPSGAVAPGAVQGLARADPRRASGAREPPRVRRLARSGRRAPHAPLGARAAPSPPLELPAVDRRRALSRRRLRLGR